jgi:hypothetical protein
MTFGTVNQGMFAPIVPELVNLNCVAVQTRILALEGYPHRRVRVCVAVEAAGELEMGLPCFEVAL